MLRISTNMPMLDNRFQMSNLDFLMNKAQNGISSSRSIGSLRDAPIDAAHATRLDSAEMRASRYIKNIDYAQGRMAQAEGYMSEAVTLIHRSRELAIQGSNGTNSPETLSMMAVEVNELLEELTNVINAKGGDGQFLFAGDDTTTPPFLVQKGRIPGLGSAAISSVSYSGDLSRSTMEINDGRTVKLNLQGNEVFWAESQQIFGANDTEGFIVRETNRFILDGNEISLEPGDNIKTVVRKINDSGAAVKASLDPVTGSLNLNTTIPHQIWLEPVEGRALVDMGLLREFGNTQPQNNWHPDATVSGGGLVDQVISLRDALLAGNQERIGGAIVGGLDKGLDSLLRNIADLGSESNRLSINSSRMDEDLESLGNWKSSITDLDVTQAITEMKMLQYTQKAAYQVAGRILQPSLMDFLR